MHIGIVEIVSAILEVSGFKGLMQRSESMEWFILLFINGLNKSGIVVDRKMLAELAVNNVDSFAHIVEQAKKRFSYKVTNILFSELYKLKVFYN